MTSLQSSPTARTSSKTAPKRAAFWAVVFFGVVAASTALFAAGGCAASGANAAAQNARGVNLYALGDYDGAIAVFQENIAENPASAEAFYNLGSAYQRKANALGDVNLLVQAENAYWAALERNPAPETIVCCYRGVATSATARGDVEGALQALQDWSDRNPESIEPKLEIAYFLEAQERDDDAYAILEEVAAAAPNDYRAFYKMGVLQERAGNIEEALNQTTIAGKLKPTDETVAKRTVELRAQLANVLRGGALETADAVPGETKLVSSTSARSTETSENANDDASPQTPSAPESPELPESLDAPEASNAPKTQTLDAGEVVLFAAPQISGANDGDGPRWVSSTSARTLATNADSSTLPDGTGAVGGPLFVAQNVETAPPASAPSTLNEEAAPAKAVAATTSASAATETVPKAAELKPARRRTAFGSGPPSLRAGTLF